MLFNSSIDLCRLDDEIYEDFQASFPEMAEAENLKSVQKIDEEEMKSAAGKEKWRNFINKYENKGESTAYGHEGIKEARQTEKVPP